MKPIKACCQFAEILDTEPDRERFWRIARALGNPARLEIIRFLKQRSACYTGSIVEHLPLAQATVSQHIKALKEAEIVVGTTEGPAVSYCLNPETLAWYKEQVNRAF